MGASIHSPFSTFYLITFNRFPHHVYKVCTIKSLSPLASYLSISLIANRS